MLHILNGDATAEKFRESDLPGQILIWREILSEGPAVNSPSEEYFWQQRREYITQTYHETPAAYEQKVLAGLNRLNQIYTQQQEIVLWFEHDLICQINLLYLLQWFRHKSLRPNQLQLICINQHPAVTAFRGLGELTPAQLAALFAQRQTIADQDLDLAHQVWQAYLAPTPLPLESLANTRLVNFPFLATALRAHLRRFPSVKNGLNAIEEMLLQIINSNPRPVTALCDAFWAEESIFGVGDVQLMHYLQSLTAAGLIYPNPDYTLTLLGKQVLTGQTDYCAIYPITRWLGGVHLHPNQPAWRWDTVQQKIIFCG